MTLTDLKPPGVGPQPRKDNLPYPDQYTTTGGYVTTPLILDQSTQGPQIYNVTTE